jgi:hypothetical protein
MFQTKVVQEIKTHILCSVSLFLFENHAVYEIMWKNNGTAGEVTDGSMAHAHCMLDN